MNAPVPPDSPSQVDGTATPSAAPTAAAATPPTVAAVRPPRAGELTLGWRVITLFAWIGVVLALAAVWNTSVQLGLSTWWLGPRAAPRSLAIRLSPFLAPALMLLGTINQARRLAWFGLLAAGIIAAYGVGDLGRETSLGVLQLVIAGAAAAVSIASFAGTYRAGPDSPEALDARAAASTGAAER